jgi:hypothetical protein
MRAEDLARELGMGAPALRRWLRRTFPRPAAERNAPWVLTDEQVRAARAWRGSPPPASAETGL